MSDYVHSIYFIGNSEHDWLAKIYKEGNKEPWILEYRFRYKVHDSEDKKNWYKWIPKSLEKAIEGVEFLKPIIEQHFSSKLDTVLLECLDSDPKFLFELGSRPWTHLKLLPGDSHV